MVGPIVTTEGTHSPISLIARRGPVECAIWGEGPAVILLHGSMGGWDQGAVLARAAVGSSGFRFVAISRPGYLGTPLTVGRSFAEQADACAGVLDALGIQEAAVVAISAGGPCALHFALRYTERCRALVLISACSAPFELCVPFRFQLLKRMARLPMLIESLRQKNAANPERAARRAISDPVIRARTLADPVGGPMLIEFQSSTLDRVAARIPGAMNDIVQTRLPFASAVEQITAPVLIVHGTADAAVSFEQSEALSHRIRASELLAIDRGEHVSLFTHRDLIQSHVTRFLDDHIGWTAALRRDDHRATRWLGFCS